MMTSHATIRRFAAVLALAAGAFTTQAQPC